MYSRSINDKNTIERIIVVISGYFLVRKYPCPIYMFDKNIKFIKKKGNAEKRATLFAFNVFL